MIVASAIRQKLELRFAAEHVEVLNESGNHNVPAGSETHFRVVVVSSSFQGMGRLPRHRAIHSTLAEELEGPVHALAIDAWTPEEWAARGGLPAKSPDCLGGDGSLVAAQGGDDESR